RVSGQAPSHLQSACIPSARTPHATKSGTWRGARPLGLTMAIRPSIHQNHGPAGCCRADSIGATVTNEPCLPLSAVADGPGQGTLVLPLCVSLAFSCYVGSARYVA